MSMPRRWLTLIGLLFALALLPGCGSKTYPVEGNVEFEDGAPAQALAGYLVMFQSVEEKVSASGTVQADGSFTVGTFQDGDGAIPGKHRVALTPPAPELHKPLPVPAIAAHYGRFDASELEVDVKRERNHIVVKVKRLGK